MINDRAADKGFTAFLNGKQLLTRSDSDLLLLVEKIQFHLEMKAAQNDIVPAPGRNGAAHYDNRADTAAQQTVSAPLTISAEKDVNHLYQKHREASRALNRPATYREILEQMVRDGFEPTEDDPRSALSRRIRGDKEMERRGAIKIGDATGAAEAIYALKGVPDLIRPVNPRESEAGERAASALSFNGAAPEQGVQEGSSGGLDL